ncbi:fimbrial protein FimV [Paraburkholderia phytofirmans OLGA172]|uniref:Fimbrial protein FimV n=1 Tax=Paraburkholderia phytofirmans OLGA172 TaxID=1417228 RepID=A0A160FQW2_9BURK|nr:FimV/HubP family polar landmark protein [Paraburkholderia phytofirmans]ANB75122.1 fimbrial protein FimV [Paraburkholderia phytofirmans OLGA172]
MNLRLSSLRAMSMHQGTSRLTAAAALALALSGVGVGSAVAAPGDAASAPEGASVSHAAGSQYTVKSGQSLNDVAIAVTQSHDRGTLARASRALFDANPNAFMNHDPSRMRVGALLTVPALDASGALAASAPGAGSASAALSAATAAPAATPSAAAAGAAVGAASGAAQVNAAAASAASAAARAAAPATSAVSGAASSTAEASSATPGSLTAAGAIPAAPVAGSPAAGALPGSGAHVWSGAIQPSARETAEGASAVATAQPASQPRAQVSSLQQLLALKNRVLMELQKHGIGGSPAATVKPSTNGVQPAAGVSSAVAVSGHGGAAISTSNDAGISQTNLSVAAAIGAALVVLLAALRMRRRKRAAVAAAEGSLAADAAAAAGGAAGPQDIPFTGEEIPAREAPAVSDEVAAPHRAALAERETAERAAAEGAASARAVSENAAAPQVAAERVQAEPSTVDEAAPESAAAEPAAERTVEQREAAEHPPHTALPVLDLDAPQHASHEGHAPASFEPAQPIADTLTATQPEFASEPLPAAHHENFDGATTAASLAAAAELGADALPLTSLEPVDETLQQEVPPHRLQWDDEPEPIAAAEPPAQQDTTHVEPAHQPSDELQPQPESHQQADTAMPDAASEFELPPVAPTQPALSVPTEFPRDAVDAFSSLNMPLPPRIESTDADAAVSAPASLSTQPVASAETAAQQAVASHDPDDAAHIADEISAGTAGHAAVAGLGAAGFGALKLDFDLELPPSPAQPLPAFTQADLTRIARNKLDLAAEYIDLGDLSGARMLINEVIEANDPATRTEARALLSTLAPLS